MLQRFGTESVTVKGDGRMKGSGEKVEEEGYVSISKSWKVRYHPAALVIEVLPRQGVITNYNSLFVS